MTFNEEFRIRTKKFALRNIKLYQSLRKSDESRIIGKQLLRAGTSVGSNFRAATRARSRREYFSKLSIVVEEADESAFWMELLIESGIVNEKKLCSLYDEAIEITKVMASARKTLRVNDNSKD